MHQRKIFKQLQQRDHAKQKPHYLQQQRKLEIHRDPEHIPFHPEKKIKTTEEKDKRGLFLLLVLLLPTILPDSKLNHKTEKPHKPITKGPANPVSGWFADAASVFFSDVIFEATDPLNTTSATCTEEPLTPLEGHDLILTTVANREKSLSLTRKK